MYSGYDAEQIGSCLAKIDRLEHRIAAVDDPTGDMFQEEYDSVHSTLVRLGVINADKLSYVYSVMCLDKLPDVVTSEFVRDFLEEFEFDSSHSKIEALISGDQLIAPIARLVRASRIFGTVFQSLLDLMSVRCTLNRFQERLTSLANQL